MKHHPQSRDLTFQSQIGHMMIGKTLKSPHSTPSWENSHGDATEASICYYSAKAAITAFPTWVDMTLDPSRINLAHCFS